MPKKPIAENQEPVPEHATDIRTGPVDPANRPVEIQTRTGGAWKNNDQ